MKKVSVIIILFFAGIIGIQAQTCTEKLQQAQRDFDDGLLEGIQSQLDDCMKNGFTKEEKANAYKLLIQTYIYSQDIRKADEAMLDFLNEFPSYTIAENDPKEFIDLYNTYSTDPVFNIELNAGLSLSVPVIVNNFSPVDSNTDPEEYYIGAGIAFDAAYVNELKNNFSYGIGFSFLYSSMGYWSVPYEFTELEATLWDMHVGLPLTIRYDHPLSDRISLYGRAGLEPVYLLQHRIDFTRTDNGGQTEPYTGVEPATYSQKRFDLRPRIGIGAKIDVGRDYLIINFEFRSGTIQTIKEESPYHYPETDLGDKYLYFPDSRLNNHMIFSLSYMRPIYNPQKIR